MAKAEKSSSVPKYTIRTCLIWLVPPISLAFGFAMWIPFLLSALLTPVEIPKLRQRVFGNRAKKQLPCLKAPALMRLVVLWVLQVWWIVLCKAGIAATEVEAPAGEEFGGSSDMEPDGISASDEGAPPTGLRGTLSRVRSAAKGARAEAWKPETLSVVLPCAGEGEYALNTVRAVFTSTPEQILHEIIVVDDGTSPPLAKTVLPENVQTQYRVKLIRHKTTVGLIGAKQDGGMAATGDIIVFFDCHVAPQPNWHKPFLRLVGENYKRIVVPMITDLDVGTWMQKSANRGQAKCYLTWDADFKWFDSSDHYVPVLSGGLLGISRRWWNETRGYDDQMRGWGGENLDQSLRSWLCGGEIVVAQDSQVAHMWRGASDPRTHAKYVAPFNAAAKNRMRAAVAWFGEFAEKLGQFPALQNRPQKDHKGNPWYGDISNILAVKEDLKCKSFAWFMHRFKHVYEDGGLIPKQTFQLRTGEVDLRTGEDNHLCLTYKGQAGTSPNGRGTASLEVCKKGEDRQRWHGANRDTSKQNQPCCSGLRAWNTDQCIVGAADGVVSTWVCDISGQSPSQAWQFVKSTGQIKQAKSFGRGNCIEAQFKSGGRSSDLQVESCSSNRESDSESVSWIKENPLEPIESRLYRKAALNNFA
mmetsp:Transcript_15421/g.26451  ORF Transcript_15421/g.26451 Transcript_15421/m.26451 type:complete len:642 (+) Transcript_15421:161-2086(+)